jgi:hypothetical protein
MRDALDLASAIHELATRGDRATVAKLATLARNAVEIARRSRTLDPERRRRASLRRDVERLRARGATAAEIVDRVSMWPELNELATPDQRPVRGRRGRLTTPEEMTEAVRVVKKCMGYAEADTIIVRALVALGVSRDRARAIAGKRTK